MSWDADLHCDSCGHSIGDWNYTHNTNGMIAAALTALGCVNANEVPSDHPIWKLIGPAWWKRLDGCDGPTGAEFLQALADELDRLPDVYGAMNPPNGWGSRAQLVGILRAMVKAVPEAPCRWVVSG